MDTSKLLTITEYAALRGMEQNNRPMNPSYIYRLIDQVKAGKKTWEQLGFEKVEIAGKPFIKLLT